MHEHGLAKELWPQLRELAEREGFKKVTRIEMTVGMLHGVSADFLIHSFEHAFEGTGFEGAAMQVTIVEPGQEIHDPQQGGPVRASGWELMITRIEGER